MENKTNTVYYKCLSTDKKQCVRIITRITDENIYILKTLDGFYNAIPCKRDAKTLERDRVELYDFNTIDYTNANAKDNIINHLNIYVLPKDYDYLVDELYNLFDPELKVKINSEKSVSMHLGDIIGVRGLWTCENDPTPKYPIGIVSYSRCNQYGRTHKTLTDMKVQHYLFVEPDQHEDYYKWYDPTYCKLIMGSENYHNQKMGSTPMRNCILDYFKHRGFSKCWLLDDNIKRYMRLHHGTKNPIDSSVVFTHIENYVDQYDNVGIASHNFNPEIRENDCRPCVVKNGKQFSSLLIPLDNDIRFRYKYNEDHLISMEYINKGFCNLCFNSVCYDKNTSGKDSGGNAQSIYLVGEEVDGYKLKYDYTKCLLTVLQMEGKLKLIEGKTIDDLMIFKKMVSKSYHARFEYGMLIGNDNKIVKKSDYEFWKPIDIPTLVFKEH